MLQAAPPKRMLLDSGAFSCWNRGTTIDLEAYIKFAAERVVPGLYVVNLDVIPGVPNDPRSLTTAGVERACEQGWENYREMRRTIPVEHLVPVFHMNDDFKWIKRYLDDGVTYLGISPANDRTTDQKLRWLMQVRPYLCDAKGDPVVRTHGFAVTSYRLMKFWHWFSVDSASWIRQAAVGGVYCPEARGSFAESPMVVSFSPRSPQKSERNKHYTTLSPSVRRRVDKYIDEFLQLPRGEWREEPEPLPPDGKLAPGQRWLDKAKRTVMTTTQPGLITDHQYRFYANMRYLQASNEVLPVDHIFFAGSGPCAKVEKAIGRRLISYQDISTSPGEARLFERHHSMLKREQNED